MRFNTNKIDKASIVVTRFKMKSSSTLRKLGEYCLPSTNNDESKSLR